LRSARLIAHSINEMLSDAFRKIVPTLDLGDSIAEDHAAQLIAETLGLFGVSGVTETLSEVEKLLLPALLRLDAIFDQLHEHAIGADPAILSQVTNLGCGFCRKGDALPDCLIVGFHSTRLVRF